MITRTLMALFVAATAAAPAARAAERVVQKTYPAQPGCLLKVDTYRGNITVRQADDAQIHIEIHVLTAIDDPAEAKLIFDRLKLEFKSEGNGISVLVRNPQETRFNFVWDEKKRLALEFVILVPPSTALDLAAAEGGIAVGNLIGRIDARTKGGTITLRQIDGEVRASAESGEVILSRCSGSATIKTFQGGIRVGTIYGRADLRTTDGDISILHALGGLSVVAVVGDVEAGFSKDFSHEARIATNGGAVTVRLDPAARCDIQAFSVWGRVHTKLPIAVNSGGDGKKSLVGRLNGGGPLLVIHADGGQIHVIAPAI